MRRIDEILAGPRIRERMTPEMAAHAHLGPGWKAAPVPAPFTHAFSSPDGQVCLVLVPKLGHGMLRARGAFGAIAKIALTAAEQGHRVLICTPAQRNYAKPLRDWIANLDGATHLIGFAEHPPSFGHPGWRPARAIPAKADRTAAIAAVLASADPEGEAKAQGARLGVRHTTVATWVERARKGA